MTHTQQRPKWKPPFFTIWTGQQLSWIGSAVAGFALVWWLTETTGSAIVLATGTLATVLPSVFLGPLVGALVDRWNRRAVMLVADGVIALFSAWLAYLFLVDALELWHVYVIMLVRAVGVAFHVPSMQASTSLMVPKEHLGRVAGLNQAMGGIVNITSPPLGALLLGFLPLHTIMAIDVVTAAFSIVPLLFISVPQPRQATTAAGAAKAKPSLWTDMRAGLRYVWSWPGLLAICVLAMMLNFLAWPAMSLTPLLVADHFGGGAVQLGWMNSAWGLGLVLGGLTLSAWGGFKKRIVTALVGIVGSGVGTLVVGLTPAAAFPLALAAFFFGAVMNAMCNGSAFALLQQVVAPEMQGRVFTLVGSMCNAVTPLAMIVAGPVAEALGVRVLYVMSGGASVLLGLGSFLVPAIMHVEDNHEAHAVEGEVVEAAAVPVYVEAA